MAYQIAWTRRARRDLDGVLAYVAEHDSRMRADQLDRDILQATLSLGPTPLRGAVYKLQGRSAVREIICHRYRIFYRVIKSRRIVEILAIWHGSRQEPEFL